ncbi:MAG: D-alanyl-D-alanine carboxypeptidase [Candidatus Eisenbacteria sp.]|nr:D-alanyl-D-alanine carboxypeptidase [Candidatus Eisenbacteria bacterium]
MKMIAPLWAFCLVLLAFMVVSLAEPSRLSAESYAAAGSRHDQAWGPIALQGDFATAIVMDAVTGEILGAKKPHEQRQPASMVKMMTELLILEEINKGNISLSDVVTVSAQASRMGGSQAYLKQGECFTVESLLMALAIHSANDAAVALAEYHSGSTAAFVRRMNRRAQELGMRTTVFRFVHGLPPSWKQKPDLTTAYDMALLGCEVVKHPKALQWASTRMAPFRAGKFTLYNSNSLIDKYPGLDGLKTGYHYRAGFCMTATAVRDGRRLVTVVMGAPNPGTRGAETARLLDFGFSCYTHLRLPETEGQPLAHGFPVKGGKSRNVTVACAEPLTVSVLKDRADEVILELVLEEGSSDKLPAPVKAGQVVGKAVAVLSGRALGEVPIIAVESVAKGSFLDQLWH